jgi:glycosyltransferase involved in cell wall biosynthesis
MLLTNPATYDQRPLKEGHSLARRGFDVTILAWDRDGETRSDTVYPDGLKVKRMRIRAGHGTPYLTLPKLAIFYLWCLAHLLTTRADVVHSHDVDTLPVGVAVRVLAPSRPRLVYDMHDLPEAFLRFFPLLSVSQPLSLALGSRWADRVLVVNERFVSYLAGLGFDRQRMVVVMNTPSEKEQAAKERGVNFEVLYYGWLGEMRGVRLLVEALKGLRGVELTIAGRGELEPWVREMASQGPNIEFMGWLKMKDLEPLINRADLIPSIYEPKNINTILSTPGKLFTAMSRSLPLLVPSGTYQAEIVQKYGCGIAVEYGNAAELRRVVNRLADQREYYDQLATASRRAFLSSFSWEVMEERLAEAYEEMLKSRQ